MKVTVVGLGYVGLVTSAGLATWGHRVTGVDASRSRLKVLAGGELPFFEPGLDDLVLSAAQADRLRFTDPSSDAMTAADVVITAVGTHDGNGGWQTAAMETCLNQVVPHLRDDAVLVVRSTLPPDYVRSLGDMVAALRHDVGRPMIPVLLNPEFTREGRAILDFMQPDRLVFGIVHDPDGEGEARLRALYSSADAPVLVMPAMDAAFAKLGANLFRATKISFANELARLCDAHGAVVDNVVAAMSYDARIGGEFLRPGVGFGGSCLPHQVSMTVKSASIAGVPSLLLAAVWEVNQAQRELFVERLDDLLGGLRGRRIAILGLAFKADTDDLRDAPSLTIARRLIDDGADVIAYDPMAKAREHATSLIPGLRVAETAARALAGADVAALVTDWPEFSQLDWASIGSRMRRRVVLDGRNALNPSDVTAAGFKYVAFGRGGPVGQPMVTHLDGVEAEPTLGALPIPSYSNA